MAWFQVDDQLAMHRKVCEAGNAAMGLWVRAGSWSMANLTEGFVSKSAAKTLGTAAQAKALVASGLWVEVDGGYQFHEWGTRQLSAEQIAEKRRKRAEAGRKGGQSKRLRPDEAKLEAKPEAKPKQMLDQLPKQNGTPVPVPVLEGVTWGGNGTEVDASRPQNDPPPCPRHPDGYDHDEPCRRCQRLREHDQATADQRDLDARRAEDQRRIQIQAAISACRICDPQGQVDMPDLFGDGQHPTDCPHDAAEIDRARQEILAARAQMADQ